MIPTVTSRYPLWDVKSPELTAEVPHTQHGDERNDVASAASTSARSTTTWRRHAGRRREPHAKQASTKVSLKTAEELGIPMPYPTIKPLFVALFMTLMFASLLFIHEDKTRSRSSADRAVRAA